MELPALNEDSCPIGTQLRPYQVTYDRDFVQQFLNKTGESLDDYLEQGQQLVPPGVFLGAYARLIHESFHYETGVHVSSDVQFLKAVPLGTEATVAGEALRLFERNGDKYITFSVVISDESGQLLAHVEHTSIYDLKPRR